MPDILSAPRGDLIKLIYDLVEQNNGLRIQIRSLTSEIAKLKKELKKQENTSDKKPPSFVKENIRRKKKKTKRKKRALNFTRKRQKPDEHVFHTYDTCPTCDGNLGSPSVAFTREVIDIPLPKFEITEHVFFKRWCANCKIRIYPKPNLKNITVGKQRFGINLQSLVSTLSEEFRYPLNKIRSFLAMTYTLEISEGAIVKLLATTTKKGEGKYSQIKKALRRSNVVYADETGSRENGVNGYQWSFSNNNYQFNWYHKKRNKKVVREFVGEEGGKGSFNGVLASDFFASYNEYNGFHQRCWVHLLRDIKKLQKELNYKHPPLNIWAKNVREIYKDAKNYKDPDQKLPAGLQAEERIQKEAYFKEKIKKVCEPYTARNSPMSTLCVRMINFLPELFTFIRFPGIDPDNNQAERALRHSVVKRKISGGTRSAKGSHTREVLASLFGTWRL